MLKRLMIVFSLLAALSGGRLAVAQRVFEFSGQITQAENLSFAVLNGGLLASNPQPGDLPLDYTATLRVPAGVGSAFVDFGFNGEFESPTRSFTFDAGFLSLPVNITANDASLLQIEDSPLAFDSTVFALTVSLEAGVGGWVLRDFDSVPTNPPGDRTAEATITSFRIITNASPGDFNNDGFVDAADYTVWRDGLGDAFTLTDYAVWVGNFGDAEAANAVAVPEPSLLGLFTPLAFAARRRPPSTTSPAIRSGDRSAD